MRLRGKTAVVTGAGSGIGRSIALRFAKEGARVVANDVAPTGEETVAAIVARGGDARFVRADLRSEAEARAVVEEAVDAYGALHVLVNNAGVTGHTNVLTATEDDWERVMNTNLKGAWHCCKHAIPHMANAGGGSIVNVSSTHVYRTQQRHFPYHAAKGGLHAMTLGLCVEFGGQGIRANNLCPGFILTPLAEAHLQLFEDREAKERTMLASHPLGRFGMPEDVANAALFLASDEARFVSGASLVVDGGRMAFQKAE
ncbi:SDR family NAD(P)-dependent oxidoreductase [Paenibacillus sp.]|uniref:SDR family NAD(P)-dependent oxidoreductase n=1 Tax=Paenibacillus sp. TaxID=58172 RepID=UPI00281253C4|nr:SDR family NAD(P)-dependent oxidoreductase [Paenibacillus sp.]